MGRQDEEEKMKEEPMPRKAGLTVFCDFVIFCRRLLVLVLQETELGALDGEWQGIRGI